MSESITVMLVEDDRYIALALKIRLAAGGYTFKHASNIADAESMAAEELPDVCVIDVNLPDGNGIELMQSLLCSSDHRRPANIVMTASRRTGLKEHALQAGAVAFLEKPFASNDLLNIIALHGNQRQASVEK